ncbi:MAG: hypothetical protein VCB59_02330 [Gammaproteobacteria bacterium]
MSTHFEKTEALLDPLAGLRYATLKISGRHEHTVNIITQIRDRSAQSPGKKTSAKSKVYYRLT